MAAVTCPAYSPRTVTLATTCTELSPTAGVAYLWVIADAEWYLVLDDSVSDGGALPTHYYRVPADTAFPVPVAGHRILIAAATGTPTANIFPIGQ